MVNYAYKHFLSHVNTVMWHCCIYKKRNVRLSSDVPFIVYVSYCKNAIVYQAYRSPPYGGGAGGRAFPLIVYVSYCKNAIVYPAYRSPPYGGGAGGGAFPLLFIQHTAPLPAGEGQGVGLFPYYFLPKSAGTSPHLRVSHFTR